MKIDAHPEFVSLLTKPAQISLSNNNRRLLEGSNRVLLSPTFEGTEDDQLREKALELLSDAPMTDTLWKIEEDNMSKLGPRSIAKPWSDRKASLFAYFHKPSDFIREDISYKGTGSLRPVSLEKAVANLIPSSNSGLPDMVRKSKITLDRATAVVAGVSYPCVLYTRTAEQKKTRNIWGFPLKDTLNEARFLIPYLRMERELPHRTALKGPDFVDIAVSSLFQKMSANDSIVCVDFEAFDASVSEAFINHVFAGIASHFQERYHDEIEEITRRFRTIPIYTPDGTIEGSHGVPSGSGFTNTVDSAVQLEAVGSRYASSCQIQGDDGIYIESSKRVQGFLGQFERQGLRINRDKTWIFSGPEGVYLQRYYHPQYTSNGFFVGVYPISRALARIKYLESFTDFEKLGIDGRDYFSLRTIMILENCKHHPCFKKLVEYVHAQDKYGLFYTEQGLKAFSKAMKSKARAGQFVPQEDLRVGSSGIQNFATMQVLQEIGALD